MLVLLAALWTLWGACWLRRVELRRDNEPVVDAMGLTWVREGLGPSVRARGAVGGHEVEVRWRRGLFRDRVRLRVGGAWRPVASGADVGAELRALESPPA